MSRSLYVNDLVCIFRKSRHKQPKLIQWQPNVVDMVDPSLPSFLYGFLNIFKLVLVLNIADGMSLAERLAMINHSDWRPFVRMVDHSIPRLGCKQFAVGLCFSRRAVVQTGPSWPCSYGSWIYNYLCNQCLSPLML